MEGMDKGLEGILKWSLAHSDGTAPAKPVSEEDRKWFLEALQSQQVDVAKRMKELAAVMATPRELLEEQGVTVDEMEGLLGELQDHVESIDNANDLQAVGGLQPLLNLLSSPHPQLRSRAAEVVSTVVQNNGRSQEAVMKAGGLGMLMRNLGGGEEDEVARTKAMGAISSLIQHNPAGVEAFRVGDGFRLLREALQTETPKLQRKSLNVLRYLLQQNSADLQTASELGFHPLLLSLLTNSDADLREASLKTLLHIANHSPENAAELARGANTRGTNTSGASVSGANAGGKNGGGTNTGGAIAIGTNVCGESSGSANALGANADAVPDGEVSTPSAVDTEAVGQRGGEGEEGVRLGAVGKKSALAAVLDGRMEFLEGLNGQDLESSLEERNLVDALWEVCFYGPSRLRTGVGMVEGGRGVEDLGGDLGSRGFSGAYNYGGEEMAERGGPPLMLGAP